MQSLGSPDNLRLALLIVRETWHTPKLNWEFQGKPPWTLVCILGYRFFFFIQKKLLLRKHVKKVKNKRLKASFLLIFFYIEKSHN